MIQDILPLHFHNQYNLKKSKPNSNSFIIFVDENNVLIKKNGSEIEIPKFSELANCEIDTEYLFSVDEDSFFLAEFNINEKRANYLETLEALFKDGFGFVTILSLRHALPAWLAFSTAVGHHLADWYNANKFCGKCGKPLMKDAKERMMRCASCGNMVFPKISPAVIVAVIDNDKILLTNYAGRAENKNYALIAGFTEIGETVEETVEREVFEEVGLHVKNIQYYKSQPWPFTDTLLMGYFCEVQGSSEIVLDESELANAEWISRENLPIDDDGISLTYEMIGEFKRCGNAIKKLFTK